MFQRFDHRAGHYGLLLLVAGGLFLPNLGQPSLWDIDEAHNSEAAREMLECGNWVVPTFNFQLRVDKPALLYWLQIAAYQVFGVNEFAARLPSALAAMLTMLVTYELGRLLFGPATGLLAGAILASTVLFCAAAHFANPDALLNACTLLAALFLWLCWARSNALWFIPAGLATGAAVLAKGPVGIVLPSAVFALFALWCGRFRLLWSWGFLAGTIVFSLVAAPWYVWVSVDTRTDFLQGFILTHNVGRYLRPMENHGGPVYYYLLVLAVGLAPWSAFLGLTAWNALREAAINGDTRMGGHGDTEIRDAATRRHGKAVPESPSLQVSSLAVRYLACWIFVYLAFFSFAGTKLPNYILPIYAPLAMLTARFLDRWRRGIIQPPAWTIHLSLVVLVLMGCGICLALLVVAGVLPVPALRGRLVPELAGWAGLGLLPVLGAGLSWWFLKGQHRLGFVVSMAGMAIGLSGTLAAWGGNALENRKAPRLLAQSCQVRADEQEIRIACYQYYQPSLVFYCQREVHRVASEPELEEFLASPLPVYLFVPAKTWQSIHARFPSSCRVLGSNPDLYRGYEVALVTNR